MKRQGKSSTYFLNIMTITVSPVGLLPTKARAAHRSIKSPLQPKNHHQMSQPIPMNIENPIIIEIITCNPIGRLSHITFPFYIILLRGGSFAKSEPQAHNLGF
jgi:hypothetical protein